MKDYESRIEHEPIYKLENFSGYFGLLMFNFPSNVYIYELRNSLRKKQQFKTVFWYFFIVLMIFQITMGTLVSFGYNNNVIEFVLFKLGFMEMRYQLLVLAYLLTMALTFPINLLPMLNISDELLSDGSDK